MADNWGTVFQYDHRNNHISCLICHNALKIDSSLVETIKKTNVYRHTRKKTNGKYEDRKILVDNTGIQRCFEERGWTSGSLLSNSITEGRLSTQNLKHGFDIHSGSMRDIRSTQIPERNQKICGEVTVFTDSLEVVNALEASASRTLTRAINKIRSTTYELQQNNINNINIVWIPGHTGIVENERANDAAMEATEKDDIEILRPISTKEANASIRKHIDQL